MDVSSDRIGLRLGSIWKFVADIVDYVALF